MLPRLNPGQHRLLARHVDRALDALREADRLLRGAAGDMISRCVKAIETEMAAMEKAEDNTVRLELATLPAALVPYLEDPFSQSLSFNLFCQRTGASHTQAAKDWEGGAAAVAARNLVFLPQVYHDLWEEGLLDKTRLVAIANRNLTTKAYLDVADLVRTRRKEDVDERLLRMPPGSLQVGRRGPGEAMEAAEANGWVTRLKTVEISGDLVMEAGARNPEAAAPVAGPDGQAPAPAAPSKPVPETPAAAAIRTIRSGLSGARIAPEVAQMLELSPDPMALVEKYLTHHRQSGDSDPTEVTKTLFFAHAGPMEKLVADDKLLLRHFRPVKTQKRGQLFYRLLEVIEECLLERQHDADFDKRGIGEVEATVAVRAVIRDLNKDPNRYLVIPDEWLGEVTRRHLYFGSRTRKEGAAYKWYRKIGPKFFLGGHKTPQEIADRAARKTLREAEMGDDADEDDGDDEA